MLTGTITGAGVDDMSPKAAIIDNQLLRRKTAALKALVSTLMARRRPPTLPAAKPLIPSGVGPRIAVGAEALGNFPLRECESTAHFNVSPSCPLLV